MFERDVRVILGNADHGVAPELTRFENVRLVDARYFVAALAGRFKRNARNSLDFRHRVTHGVEGFERAGEVPVHGRAAAARGAEINVARQFTHDDEIKARDEFGFEARSSDEFFKAFCRPQVRKEPQVLAQAQNGLFGTQVPFQRIVLKVAHGTEENGVRFFGKFQRGFGERMPVVRVRHTPDVRRFHFKVLPQGV